MNGYALPEKCSRCRRDPKIWKAVQTSDDKVKFIEFICPECGISSDPFFIPDSSIDLDVYVAYFQAVESWTKAVRKLEDKGYTDERL